MSFAYTSILTGLVAIEESFAAERRVSPIFSNSTYKAGAPREKAVA